MVSVITTKGRVAIPKATLQRAGLKPGDRVKAFAHPNGGIVLLPMRPLTDLIGFLKYDGPPVSIEEMDPAGAREE